MLIRVNSAAPNAKDLLSSLNHLYAIVPYIILVLYPYGKATIVSSYSRKVLQHGNPARLYDVLVE